ncbi:Gfo/Idh/MocA family oxidoreductase [Alteribacter populi]|uniref:Gfo/Idh/MocA family oxidoreductase n=1 Tax=Alteribacter populi TaxID=2011011 RepID=UPI000BBA9512|nr:Gfo/Idh/MocA family oxidoreductase [Alteribacter populi]
MVVGHKGVKQSLTVNKIAIVGLGQIGRRHLQALKLINRPCHLFLVDASQDSIAQAKKAYKVGPEPPFNQVIHSFNDLASLPDQLDIVIIATPANVRKEVVRFILLNKEVRSLLLEKVLFQHPDDFCEINEQLIEGNVKAWVNCPLRTTPFFQTLKISTKEPTSNLNYHVSGSHLNIGSNAIHHLDLLSFLAEESSFIVDSSLLDRSPISSKRPGFLEFTGTLQATGSNGSRMTMTSFKETDIPSVTVITSPHYRVMLRPKEKKAWISKATLNWQWFEVDFTIPLQSQYTQVAVQQILDNTPCNLPTFSDSWKLHTPLLQSLTGHLIKNGYGGISKCPIT